jgi:hypothetical protein
MGIVHGVLGKAGRIQAGMGKMKVWISGREVEGITRECGQLVMEVGNRR